MTLVHWKTATIALALSMSGVGATAEIVTVVSVKSPIKALSKEQIADIFLGRTSRFPDGSRAIVIDLSEGSALRDHFYTTFVGKSAAQIKAHWAKLIFTGRGHPPKQVDSVDAIKKILADNPNAISYMDNSLVDENITVLMPE